MIIKNSVLATNKTHNVFRDEDGDSMYEFGFRRVRANVSTNISVSIFGVNI
jgi:hypothetical protein